VIPTPNDGSRPSHLQLDRYATGELSPDEAARVEASLDATSRAHLAAVENAAADLPPLDVAAVRRRAIVDPARPLPAPVNDTRAFRRWWMAGLAVAAALALFVVSPWPGGDPDAPPDVVFRGGDLLTVYAVEGSDRQPYVPGTPLGSGDTIGFSVDATGHTSVVLLSIDGAGTLTALYPEQVTDEAFPLSGTGRVALPELVTLDDAPGPEVFVAALDRSTEEIATEMLRVYGSGGHPALLAWAAETPGVDAVEVTKQ
jgi:hypothetical protein